MTTEEKIQRALEKHPDWNTRRIACSTGGTYAEVEAARGGGRDSQPDPASGTSISLSTIKDRFDVAAAIRREIARIRRGHLLPEDELCRMTAGKDRNRFRRAVDNNPDLARKHRVKLRLDETGDGKFYWGQAADVLAAIRLRDL